jgi:multiple sugar transport system permease protein
MSSAAGAARRQTLAGLLWTSPWLVGGTLFTFIPMALCLYYSFTDYPLLKPPAFIGLENYRELAGDARFWLVVRNTLLYALFAIPLSTALSLGLAALLATRGLRFAGFYKAAVFIPTLVPAVASAMVWLWLFNAQYGLINRGLGAAGVPASAWPGWLTDARWALPALLIATLWGVGQQVVVYVAAIADAPRSLYEAASLDGMGPLRRFLHVTLPMISPVVLFNVVTLTIATLQVFALPYVLFRNERGQRSEGDFYTLMLFDHAFANQRMGYASAMAWVLLLIVLALTGLLFLASKRLVHYRSAA